MHQYQTTQKRVFDKREDVVSRNIADELLIVPVRNQLAQMQRIFSLESVGEYIWTHLNGENSLKDICDGVLNAYSVQRECAEADVAEFITQLENAGLIFEVQ